MAPGIGKMYRAQVRAVLASIREPDEAMIDAGLPFCGHCGHAEDVWQAMIDEVLRDVCIAFHRTSEP